MRSASSGLSTCARRTGDPTVASAVSSTGGAGGACTVVRGASAAATANSAGAVLSVAGVSGPVVASSLPVVCGAVKSGIANSAISGPASGAACSTFGCSSGACATTTSSVATEGSGARAAVSVVVCWDQMTPPNTKAAAAMPAAIRAGRLFVSGALLGRLASGAVGRFACGAIAGAATCDAGVLSDTAGAALFCPPNTATSGDFAFLGVLR